MKKIVLTMIAILSMTVAMAQNDEKRDGNRGPRQFTPEQMVENLAGRLNLNDDQKAKLLELNKEYKDVLGGPRWGGRNGGNRPQRNENAGEGQRPQRPQLTEEQRAQWQERMKKRQEYEEKLKGIFTEEQYKQYQEMRPQRGQRRGNNG